MAVTINTRVNELAAKLQSQITVDDAGAASLPKDVFFEHAPEGITKETEKVRAEYLGDFMAAGQLATSRVAQPLMEKNKNLASVELSTNVLRDKLSWTQLRERTGRNPQTGEKTTTKGAAGAEYVVYAARKNAPQLAAVRDEIKAKFANMAD